MKAAPEKEEKRREEETSILCGHGQDIPDSWYLYHSHPPGEYSRCCYKNKEKTIIKKDNNNRRINGSTTKRFLRNEDWKSAITFITIGFLAFQTTLQLFIILSSNNCDAIHPQNTTVSSDCINVDCNCESIPNSIIPIDHCPIVRTANTAEGSKFYGNYFKIEPQIRMTLCFGPNGPTIELLQLETSKSFTLDPYQFKMLFLVNTSIIEEQLKYIPWKEQQQQQQQ